MDETTEITETTEMIEAVAKQKFKEKFGEHPTYEMAKPWLYPRPMSKALLDSYPHELVCISKLDFFVTFFVLIEDDEDSLASFPVTMEIMDDWGIESETLLQDAVANAERMLPATIESIEDAIGMEKADTDENTFYVISNRKRRYGAMSVLYKDALSDFEERLGEPFFIIPSSVHEMLLIPSSMNVAVKDLKGMLQDVNASIVPPNDILGSHIYYFDHDKGLVFADEGEGLITDTGGNND